MRTARNAQAHSVPRRHCMIVHAYYPIGETRVQREAEALLRHNYQVDVICLRREEEPAIDWFQGVRIYRLPVRRHKRRGLLVQLIEYLAFFFLVMIQVFWLYWRQRYQTIQVHNLPDFLVFSAWLPKLFGAKLILDLHDLMPEFYAGRFCQDFNSLPMRLIRLQERLSCQFADHVITVSHHWKQALIDRGVAADRISVVMNVADETIFHPLAHLPPRMPPRTSADGGLRLIYHGTVTQRYGLDLVLQAMVRLSQQASDVHFTLLGDGEYMDTLIRMARELGLNDRVTFYREMRSAEELPAIILTADAGIVPYRNDPFTDGLVPTKLMEYAALGLPAIAARTTAIQAYFSNTMVEFFEPGNIDDLVRCIRILYKSPERLRKLSDGSAKFNQRYNWRKFGAEYVALVEQLGSR